MSDLFKMSDAFQVALSLYRIEQAVVEVLLTQSPEAEELIIAFATHPSGAYILKEILKVYYPRVEGCIGMLRRLQNHSDRKVSEFAAITLSELLCLV